MYRRRRSRRRGRGRRRGFFARRGGIRMQCYAVVLLLKTHQARFLNSQTGPSIMKVSPSLVANVQPAELIGVESGLCA